jgi:hypothetical protein
LLEIDTDLDQAKLCGSDPNVIRIHNTAQKSYFFPTSWLPQLTRDRISSNGDPDPEDQINADPWRAK